MGVLFIQTKGRGSTEGSRERALRVWEWTGVRIWSFVRGKGKIKGVAARDEAVGTSLAVQ